MTQQEVADKMHCSLSAYSRIERGESQLSVTALLALSDILEVPLNAFLEPLTYPHTITTLHMDKSHQEAWTLATLQQQMEESRKDIQEVKAMLQEIHAEIKQQQIVSRDID